MGRLAIRQLRYVGEKYEFESSRLGDGLHIVEGPNGTGKTTFADLIYFALGGRVDKFRAASSSRHVEVVGDKNNYVEIDLDIDADSYVVRRYMQSNDIGVSIPGREDSTTVYPTNRREDEATFSDWLLEKLGIEKVTVVQGSRSWILGFPDLARLIYHDQAPDPSSVFKKPDVDATIFTDSPDIRRTIFEGLLGRGSTDFYAKKGQLWRAERSRDHAKATLEAFRDALELTTPSAPDRNLPHIQREIDESRSQLARLERTRSSLLRRPAASEESAANMQVQREKIRSLQRRSASREKRLRTLLAEIIDLQIVRRALMLEVTHLKKIMFADETLALFSPNTCPLCLSDVQRDKGKCVCGAELSDEELGTFFFDSRQYLSLLQGKQRNVESVEKAIGAAEEERNDLEARLEAAEAEIELAREELEQQLAEVSSQYDVRRVRRVEDQILSARTRGDALEQQYKLEERRQKLEESLSLAEQEVSTLRRDVAALRASSASEMSAVVSRFGAKYEEMMKAVIPAVRTARLNERYKPVLNSGNYTEASTLVSVRLLYYWTLLHLSVTSDALPFPRFLLVDTPETAGIDRANLIAAVGQLESAVSDVESGGFQVILTTGIGKYPQRFAGRRVLTLSKEQMLLRPRGPTGAESVIPGLVRPEGKTDPDKDGGRKPAKGEESPRESTGDAGDPSTGETRNDGERGK